MRPALRQLAVLLSLCAISFAGGDKSAAAIAEAQERAADEAEFQQLVAEIPPVALHAALHAFNPARFRHGTFAMDDAAADAMWSDDPAMASSMVAVASVVAAAANEAELVTSSAPYATPSIRNIELVRRQDGTGENATVSVLTSTTTENAASTTTVVVTTTTPPPAIVSSSTTPAITPPTSSSAPQQTTTLAAPTPTTTPPAPTTTSTTPVAPETTSDSGSNSGGAVVSSSTSLIVMTTRPPGGDGGVSTKTAVTVINASGQGGSNTAQTNANPTQGGSLQSDDVAAGLERNGWVMVGGVVVALLAAA